LCLDGFGRVDGVGFRPSSELALKPNMMYLLRLNAQTQIKSESLKPRENTMKEKPRKVGR